MHSILPLFLFLLSPIVIRAKPSKREGDSNSLHPENLENITNSLFEKHPVQQTIEVCDERNAPGRSTIYCSGKLLQAVNKKSIFKDSKTFVDRPMKSGMSSSIINHAFNKEFPQPVDKIDAEKLAQFVEKYFDKEGNELEDIQQTIYDNLRCQLKDWVEEPANFKVIVDKDMKGFAKALHNIWKSLCRRMKPEVQAEEARHSLLYVPNSFIIPGGRFREFYYWDAYWILKGLLASEMFETTLGMLYNFKHIVDTVGFIPNGGRVYYLRRSQPPLFTTMVYEYFEATRNTTALQELLPSLEKELAWWRDHRSVDAIISEQSYTMFQYRTESNVPRPESYREDVITGCDVPEGGRRQLLYRDLASAAESGWDFSTRWFADKKSLVTIQTTNIIPVDLNAFMCYNLNILSHLHKALGYNAKAESYRQKYLAFRDAFQTVFYNHSAKGWFDYNTATKLHNVDFYASMAVPFFTGCYDELSTTQAEEVMETISHLGALSYTGGVPTSMKKEAHEQWDFPNGWAPLNHMLIEGLRKSDNPKLQQQAYLLAQKWIRTNYKVFLADHAMWEKYDVVAPKPRTGGGGEYEVQAGFGWTNGAILDLLLTYGDRMTADDSPVSEVSVTSTTIASLLLLITVLIQ